MKTLQTTSPQARLALAAILLAGLILRLGWVLVVDPVPSLEGGDTPHYLRLARKLAGIEEAPDIWWLATEPMYPLYLSLFYRLLPASGVVQGARIGQAFLDTVTCWLVFKLSSRLFEPRVGLAASASLAVDLRFIVQAGVLYTEVLFTLFLVLGVWAFVVARSTAVRSGPAEARAGWPESPASDSARCRALSARCRALSARCRALSARCRALSARLIPGAPGRGWVSYTSAMFFFLCAALTRPVALPLPFLLAATLLLPKPSRPQLLIASATVGLLIVLAGLWAFRNYQTIGHWTVVGDAMEGHFWMGSRGDGQWHGNEAFQRDLNEMKARYGGRLAYVEDSLRTIAGDPIAYGRLLVTKVTRAYLQPYGTVSFAGESLKDLALGVLRGQVSFRELVAGEAFWPKLVIYIFHFMGLLGGVIGMWLTRRDWLKVLPLTLPIVYVTLVYTLLTLIPRYIFPIMPFYTILAAYAGVRLWDHRKAS